MLLLALVACLLGACATSGTAGADEFDEVLPGPYRADRPAHPVVEHRSLPDGVVTDHVRPLWRVERHPDGRREFQFLTPLGSGLDSDGLLSRICWPFLVHSELGDEEERDAGRSNDDTWLFPVAVWGDDPDEGSYLFVLPVGGTLKSKFFADEIVIRGFPFWIETRAGDWESTHLLWPLIAWGGDGERSHRRVLPLFSATDGPNGSRRALLWPLVQWATQQQGERLRRSWFLFPLLGHSATDDGDAESWTALYPFFQFAHDDRTGYRHRSALWPLHVRDHRPGESDQLWWFPFWGEYRADDGEGTRERSTFVAWPLLWDQREETPTGWWSRRMAVPLWMEVEEGPTGGEATRRELRSWPLFKQSRDADGLQSWQVPAVLPFFGWEAGEDLYERLVVLFRHEEDAEGRSAWEGPLGIVRHRSSPEQGDVLTLLWVLDVPLGTTDAEEDGAR